MKWCRTEAHHNTSHRNFTEVTEVQGMVIHVQLFAFPSSNFYFFYSPCFFKDQFADTEELHGFIQKHGGRSVNQGFRQQVKRLILKSVVLVCLGGSLDWYLEQDYWELGFHFRLWHCVFGKKKQTRASSSALVCLYFRSTALTPVSMWYVN